MATEDRKIKMFPAEHACEAIHDRFAAGALPDADPTQLVLFLRRYLKHQPKGQKSPYDAALESLCRAAIDEGRKLLKSRKRTLRSASVDAYAGRTER